MKKLGILAILLTILSFNQFIVHAEQSKDNLKPLDNYDLWVDGIKIEFKDNQKPIIDENDRTLIPLRLVSEQMGYDVKWDGSEKCVYIYNGEYGLNIEGEKIKTHLKFFIGKKRLEIYGVKADVPLGPVKIPIDTEAQLINDRTMIPLRYIFNFLNGSKYGIAYEFSNNRHRVFVKSITNSEKVEDWDSAATEDFKKFKEQNNIE